MLARPLPVSSEGTSAGATYPVAEDDSHLLSDLSGGGGRHGRSPSQELEKLDRTYRRRNSLRLWWKEILSIICSVSCLAANAGWLATVDGEPYESWHVAGINITPNAMISIFTTIAKASLLLPVAEAMVQLKWLYFQARVQRVSDLQVFDDASRGPMGSLVLLWKVNMRVKTSVLRFHDLTTH